MFFKIGVLGLMPAALLKRASSAGVPCEYCEIFKSVVFYRTFPVTASDNSRFRDLFEATVLTNFSIFWHFVIFFSAHVNFSSLEGLIVSAIEGALEGRSEGALKYALRVLYKYVSEG